MSTIRFFYTLFLALVACTSPQPPVAAPSTSVMVCETSPPTTPAAMIPECAPGQKSNQQIIGYTKAFGEVFMNAVEQHAQIAEARPYLSLDTESVQRLQQEASGCEEPFADLVVAITQVVSADAQVTFVAKTVEYTTGLFSLDPRSAYLLCRSAIVINHFRDSIAELEKKAKEADKEYEGLKACMAQKPPIQETVPPARLTQSCL